jgi:hypothetical protein
MMTEPVTQVMVAAPTAEDDSPSCFFLYSHNIFLRDATSKMPMLTLSQEM